MAKELDLVVLALCQLNDEGRLRESRAIGQDADVVLKIMESEEAHSEPDRGDILIAKQRDGERLKRIPVRFKGAFMRFEDLTPPKDNSQKNLAI